jgi:hypothetical protein
MVAHEITDRPVIPHLHSSFITDNMSSEPSPKAAGMTPLCVARKMPK